MNSSGQLPRAQWGLCDTVMARVLDVQQRQRFDAMADVVYALHADMTIGYVNAAWLNNVPDPDFHAAWGLGSDVRSAWPTRLRSLLERMIQPLLDSTRPVPPLRLDYSCPTPDQHRRFTMWLHGMDRAVLVVNAQVLAQPAIASAEDQPEMAQYLKADGMIHQCLNCRRTHHPSTDSWDWVPDWVRQLPDNATSDLCQPCERTFLSRILRLTGEPA